MHSNTPTSQRLLVSVLAAMLALLAAVAVSIAMMDVPKWLRSTPAWLGIAAAATLAATVVNHQRQRTRTLRRVAAISLGDGVTEVIGVTSRGAVVMASYTEDGTWSKWTDLAAIGTTVDVTGYLVTQDTVEYFAVDSTGILRTMCRDHGSRTSWREIGHGHLEGRLYRIAAVSQHMNHREIFGITNAGKGAVMWRGGKDDWSEWHGTGSPDARDVAACSPKPGLMETFVVGVDGDVWHRWWWESWSDWEWWGNERNAAIAVTSFRRAYDRQEMFVVDSVGRLAHRWHTVHEPWSEWASMTTPARMVDVAGTTTSANKLHCFAVDQAGCLWQTSWNGGWGEWRPVDVNV